MKIKVIVHEAEEGGYWAEVPAIPGCATQGQTYQEAVANVETIIQEWIETALELGRPVPEPKGRLMYV